MLEMLNMPRLASRIQTLITKQTYQTDIEEIRKKVYNCHNNYYSIE